MNETTDDAVARFWRGIDSHDWALVESALANDVVRIGMQDNEADTSRGKEAYMAFVKGVIRRFEHHDLRMVSNFRSTDGRIAVSECIETIQLPGEPRLTMRFISTLELNDQGLIKKLDIFWKAAPRTSPAWITPEAIVRKPKGAAKRKPAKARRLARKPGPKREGRAQARFSQHKQ